MARGIPKPQPKAVATRPGQMVPRHRLVLPRRLAVLPTASGLIRGWSPVSPADVSVTATAAWENH